MMYVSRNWPSGTIGRTDTTAGRRQRGARSATSLAAGPDRPAPVGPLAARAVSVGAAAKGDVVAAPPAEDAASLGQSRGGAQRFAPPIVSITSGSNRSCGAAPPSTADRGRGQLQPWRMLAPERVANRVPQEFVHVPLVQEPHLGLGRDGR